MATGTRNIDELSDLSEVIESSGDCGKNPLNIYSLSQVVAAAQLRQTDAVGKLGSNDPDLSNFQEIF